MDRLETIRGVGKIRKWNEEGLGSGLITIVRNSKTKDINDNKKDD